VTPGRPDGGRMDEGLQARYLGILGLAKKAPTTGFLREVVEAHLARVPFENVSKLHWRRTLGRTALPDLRLFLTGIEEYGFGGTCYANNYHLFRLLGSLGFDVTLCGADMASPNVHVVVRVRVEGREVLVDVGYAAPFREPLPADLDADHVVAWGEDRYVLEPKDGAGRSRLEMRREGQLKHGYVVNPAPRRIEDFEPAIADSFHPSATFMNALLLARFGPLRSVVIHNLTLVESDGASSTTRQMRDRSELAESIEANFGMPEHIVDDVLAGLPAFRDPWS